MNTTPQPTPPTEYLNACFTYDPLTGDLFWKHRPLAHFNSSRACNEFNTKFAGHITGTRNFKKNGSPSHVTIQITMNGIRKQYPVGRIIYGIMGVPIPLSYMWVDHIDTNPFNNRWNNLRLSTPSQNAFNRNKNRVRKRPDLPKGVTPYKQYFRAQIEINGDNNYLGQFTTPEEAHAAYCAKATELFGAYARFN